MLWQQICLTTSERILPRLSMEQHLLGVFAARAILFEALYDEEEEMLTVHRIHERNVRFPNPPPVRAEFYVEHLGFSG